MGINVDSIKQLHTDRYNRLFTDLLCTKEYSIEDVITGIITHEQLREFLREKKKNYIRKSESLEMKSLRRPKEAEKQLILLAKRRVLN